MRIWFMYPFVFHYVYAHTTTARSNCKVEQRRVWLITWVEDCLEIRSFTNMSCFSRKNFCNSNQIIFECTITLWEWSNCTHSFNYAGFREVRKNFSPKFRLLWLGLKFWNIIHQRNNEGFDVNKQYNSGNFLGKCLIMFTTKSHWKYDISSDLSN